MKVHTKKPIILNSPTGFQFHPNLPGLQRYSFW